MKLKIARIVCLNAVILLTSRILFGAIDLKSSVSRSTNNIHFSAKSDLNIGSFSFIEEEYDDEGHIPNLSFLFDSNILLTRNITKTQLGRVLYFLYDFDSSFS